MPDMDPGEPLQASVQEQLREKAELEERAAVERRASERQQEHVERKKVDERESVLRHTGGERRVRPRRASTSRTRTASGGVPSWAVPAALVAGLWFARRSKLALVAGAIAGLAIWASRQQDELDAW